MTTSTKTNDLLQYKERPLMRKDNILYYGSMSDRYIIMMQILETKKTQDLEVATRIAVQLQQTSPNVRPKDRIVKKTEKTCLWDAMDIASIWLSRALSVK